MLTKASRWRYERSEFYIDGVGWIPTSMIEERDVVVLQSGDKSTVEKIDKVVYNKCPKKKPYSKSRPRYAKGLVEKVWENAKEPKNYRPELPSTNRSNKYE